MTRCTQQRKPDLVLACATAGMLAGLFGCGTRPPAHAAEQVSTAAPAGVATPAPVTPAPVTPARVTPAPVTQARVAIAHGLPRLDGARLEATVVEVTYPPGGSSAPHSHPCPVIGYVVEGKLRTQVKGEPAAVYAAGESFYEAPNSAHVVSANASREQPARFLAYFVCDRKTPLSVALPDTTRGQGSEH